MATLALRYNDTDTITEVGIDEAGRGPLWGPLMAAAVVWPNESEWTDAHREIVKSIRDSKKISAKKRGMLYGKIKEHAAAFGVGIVHADDIDRYGASWANQTVFRRAVEDMNMDTNNVRRYIVDGTLSFPMIGKYETCVTVIEGDGKYISVAAASILAKVAHDTWVENWCAEHVELALKYDLASCKGYGTAKHRQAIKDHGLLTEHRRLYCRKIMPELHAMFPDRVVPKVNSGGKYKKKSQIEDYDFVDDEEYE